MNMTIRVRPLDQLFAYMLVVLIATGCATTQPPLSKDPFFDEWNDAKAASKLAYSDRDAEPRLASTMIAETTMDAAPEEEATQTPQRTLPTNLIEDFNMPASTDVGTVLRALARAANQNILISENATGSVNFNFTSVPWDQAFQGVLTSAGLTYAWEGEIIRVMTLDDMKRELEIEKLHQERQEVKADLRRVEPLHMHIVKIKFMSAESMGDTLKALLFGSASDSEILESPRGSVTVDKENNAVILHSVKDDLTKMQALIAQLDVPRPQVLIEAKIVEANRDTARQLGVQWGGVSTTTSGNRLFDLDSSSYGANIADSMDENLGLTLNLLTERFGGGDLLTMQLTALQEDGRVNILSSPSITTLDNEKASIESGEERAYRETSGTGNNLDVSIEWKKAVLKLEVTPHVIDANRLKLDVTANKDSFDDTKQESNGEFPVNTKNAVTTIMMYDGKTTVIGGLSEETEGEIEKGIPILMNIPIIGYLFKGRTTSATMDETLIFITPHIL